MWDPLCIQHLLGEMGRLAPHPHWVTPMALRAFSHPSCSYQNFLQPCLDTCPYSPGRGCGPGSQGFGVPTLTFCASIVVAKPRHTHIFQEDTRNGLLSLAPSLHTFSLSTAVSALFVSQDVYLHCQIGGSFMVCCLQESGTIFLHIECQSDMSDAPQTLAQLSSMLSQLPSTSALSSASPRKV